MSKSSPKLQWLKVRLGEDLNWWVSETSDPIHWDADGLGIIDPRQNANIMESLDALRDYGLDPEIIETTFIAFRVAGKDKDNTVELRRVQESFLELDEQLFILPDTLDEEKSPYADFLDKITRCRVKLLNDLIDFEEKLEIEEIEDEIREEQNKDYMEGKATHFFNEVTTILDYVPDGYELELGDDGEGDSEDEDDIDIDLPDIEEDDEKIERDETMRWDDEEEEDDFDKDDEEEKPEEEPEEEEKPKKRGRPRKS